MHQWLETNSIDHIDHATLSVNSAMEMMEKLVESPIKHRYPNYQVFVKKWVIKIMSNFDRKLFLTGNHGPPLSYSIPANRQPLFGDTKQLGKGSHIQSYAFPQLNNQFTTEKNSRKWRAINWEFMLLVFLELFRIFGLLVFKFIWFKLKWALRGTFKKVSSIFW